MPWIDLRKGSWVVLGALLVGLLWAVVSADRDDWPTFVGDEATYPMAADSLARDFDLIYGKRDYDRFVERWKRTPEGLILLSGDHGAHMTFSKPFFYPTFIAPFVWLAPHKGAQIANVLLLALAATMSARTLRRWIGPSAPLLIAVFVFSSAAFGYAFWAHADLFLLSLAAISLSLVFSDPEGQPTKLGLFKWAIGGALLAALAFSRPFYAPLLIPAAFCAPRPRLPRLASFWAGTLLLIFASLTVHKTLGDSWTSYDGQRAAFSDETGYPEVDFPSTEWDAFVYRWGNLAWRTDAIRSGNRLSVPLWLWNGFYFLAGRHVGVLVYFLPLLLGLAAGPKDSPRWALTVAVVAAVAGVFYLRPFNFFGGGAAIANRHFLPIYPAFWFLAAGPLKIRWLAVVTLVSGLFLWPLWIEADEYLLGADGRSRFVSPIANSALPFETTQRHIGPSGSEDFQANGLWIRPLGPEVGVAGPESSESLSHAPGTMALASEATAHFLVGSEERVGHIVLTILGSESVVPDIEDAEALSTSTDPAQRRFLLRLGPRRAIHPTWWTWQNAHLYRLDITFRGVSSTPVAFSLSPLESKPESSPN